MVVPDSHWVTRAPWYSGSPSSKLGSCRRRGYHPLWPAFPDRLAKILVFDLPTAPYHRPTETYNTTATTHTGLTSLWFRLFPFRSPLLGESQLISVPAGTEMLHFVGFSRPMDSDADRRHSSPGFPHSDILGSRPACGSPKLIAASYVLLRLLMPGHSPYTLSSLTITLLLIHMVFQQDLFSCQRTTPMIRSSAQLPRGR